MDEYYEENYWKIQKDINEFYDNLEKEKRRNR